MDRAVDFFVENFPSARALALEGPWFLLWAFTCLWSSGRLKRKHGLKTAYTRKIFHFQVFGTVAFLQAFGGAPRVCLFGGMVSLVILGAILRGSGHPFYEAIAREKVAPHRTYFIVVPYFATLLGGLASNIAFGPFAMVGYLVTGLGDAVGEPAGARFGRHVYRVPSARGVAAVRTIEGSGAVAAASFLASALALCLLPGLEWTAGFWFGALLIGVLSAAVEAVSPHGWDNLTLQVIPSWLAATLW